MPLFEYSCLSCSHEFELLVRGKATPVCPSCDSDELKKQLSLFVVGGAPPTRSAQMAESPCGSCEQAGSCAFE